jgi:CDP-diacylglycerol--serine O-phosphatidyltransferase
MVLGLVSIVLSSTGRFELAAWLIVYSTILDKADGSLARALGAGSDFGMQMDSFSDFAAFGIAPGALTWYVVSAADPTPIVLAWAGFAAVALPISASLRLARFNLISAENPTHFRGLPSTFAAGLFATFYLSLVDLGLVSGNVPPTFDLGVSIGAGLLLPPVAIGLGLLMIGNLRIPKLRKPDGTGAAVLAGVTLAILVVLAALRRFPEAHLILATGYLVVGAAGGRSAR